jgi:hypothetical protein
MAWEPQAILVPLDEARDREAFDAASSSPRAEFARELHAEAMRRWRTRSDGLVLDALRPRERPRLAIDTPLLSERDEIPAALVSLVDAHLRRTRPDMPSTTRWKLAWRAAQVGLCRIGFGQTYAEVAALPGVAATSVRPLKADYVTLLAAYTATWRAGRLPPLLDLKALREQLQR